MSSERQGGGRKPARHSQPARRIRPTHTLRRGKTDNQPREPAPPAVPARRRNALDAALPSPRGAGPGASPVATRGRCREGRADRSGSSEGCGNRPLAGTGGRLAYTEISPPPSAHAFFQLAKILRSPRPSPPDGGVGAGPSLPLFPGVRSRGTSRRPGSRFENATFYRHRLRRSLGSGGSRVRALARWAFRAAVVVRRRPWVGDLNRRPTRGSSRRRRAYALLLRGIARRALRTRRAAGSLPRPRLDEASFLSEQPPSRGCTRTSTGRDSPPASADVVLSGADVDASAADTDAAEARRRDMPEPVIPTRAANSAERDRRRAASF